MINIQIVGYKQFYAFEQRCHVQQGKVMNCGGGGSCGTCIVEVWIWHSIFFIWLCFGSVSSMCRFKSKIGMIASKHHFGDRRLRSQTKLILVTSEDVHANKSVAYNSIETSFFVFITRSCKKLSENLKTKPGETDSRIELNILFVKLVVFNN